MIQLHIFLIVYMTFVVPPSSRLPVVERAVGRVTVGKRKPDTCLDASDPFRRSGPFQRTWSQRTSTSVLPIHQDKERILHAIEYNSVTVVLSAPATGKTTQIPQMILDDALAKRTSTRIVVTNPRRFGTVSTAQYVLSLIHI